MALSRKSKDSSVEILDYPAKNGKILRNFEIFLPKFYFILPKFYFILPKFYFDPPWGFFVCSLETPDFLIAPNLQDPTSEETLQPIVQRINVIEGTQSPMSQLSPLLLFSCRHIRQHRHSLHHAYRIVSRHHNEQTALNCGDYDVQTPN